MKNLTELKFFVRDYLLPDLKNLEAERISVVRKIFFSAALVTGGLLLPYFFLHPDVFFGLIQPLLFGYIIIISFIYYYFKKNYSSTYKDLIIEKIIKFLDSNLIYEKTNFIKQEDFSKSELFSNDFTSYKGDDYVHGSINQTKIEFSELAVEKVTGSGKNRRRETIFKGLYLIADFPKTFAKKTFVLPDTAEKLFGLLGSFLQKHNLTRPALVKLENPFFEKEFVVYSEDQVEARYILSTNLMERILQFKNKCQRNIYLSFIDNKIYLAIKYSKNLFEPNIFKTLYDFKPIQEYYEDLSLMIGIVEDLNLGLNIWNQKNQFPIKESTIAQ